jgi:hypothetical protein
MTRISKDTITAHAAVNYHRRWELIDSGIEITGVSID